MERMKMNQKVRDLILEADEEMKKIGFFEHGIAHATYVAETTRDILDAAGHETLAALGYEAGILHDIGNVFGRQDHHISGGLLSRSVLRDMGYGEEEIRLISEAIVNHIFPLYEETSPMASAILIADKTDLRESRTRVIRNGLNKNILRSELEIDREKKELTYKVYFRDAVLTEEYETIYGKKTRMCEQEAKRLGFRFVHQLLLDGESS